MNNISSNTTEGPTIPSPSEAERIFKVVFYVFLFITGTIGNFLVVVVIKAKNKHRTVNDYFILNLAISDLTFLCFALPFYYYELFERFEKFEFYCKFVWPMMSITLIVSIYTLTLMAMERCRAILFPFRPRIKKHTLFLAMTSVWILSLLCMVPLMVVARPVGVFCMEKWPTDELRKGYTAVLFVLQFVLPITVIAVAYITIAVTLVKTKVPNRTSVNQRGQVIKQKTRADNIHIIRTVAIIVILFVICMLPNQIAWILMDFGGKNYQDLSEKFWLLAEALMFFHSCINPIIYGTLTRQFRDGYIQYLRYIFCCGRRYTLNGMTLSEQNNFTKSRVPGRVGHKVSFKSPTTVNGLPASCQAGPTGITSCPYGTSQTPPSPARSAASSIRSHPSPVRSHPSPVRSHPSPVRSHASLVRSATSSGRSHPSSVRSHSSPVRSHPSPLRSPPNPSSLRGKPTESRPSSPLIFDNKKAIDTKLSSVKINDKYSLSKQELSIKDSKFSNLNGECPESTVLKNPNAHDKDHDKKDPMAYSLQSSISQSEGTTRISQSRHPTRISQSEDTSRISQSKETSTYHKVDDSRTSKSSGSSGNIDDDQPSVLDTYL